MKKVFLFLVMISFTASAQRFELLKGSLESLGNIREYNVTFDYAGQTVHGYETEEAFLADKTDKRRDNPEKAEKFRSDWFTDRTAKYEPKFIEYFNKRFPKGETKISENPDAKYTMNIKTTWIYPGYNVVAGAEPAKITAIITVFDTKNPSKILVSLLFDKSIGLPQGQFDFDPGYRIAGAYEKLAKNMAMQIKRFL